MEFEKEQVWRRLSGNGEYENYYCLADEAERESLRTWVKDLLHSQAVMVEFKKADGSIRVMNCTLSDLHGAKYTQTPVVENAAKEPKAKKPNEDVCVVWDIDAGAWRSFRWDRLIRIDYKLG
jgi:hypothetical protein